MTPPSRNWCVWCSGLGRIYTTKTWLWIITIDQTKECCMCDGTGIAWGKQ